MKPLRVAIIGQGRSGRDIHAATLQKMPRHYKIVAVVDPIKDRRDRAAGEFGCDAYRDHKPLLKRQDLDLVVNATPNHLHMPIALDLWQAGHHVLVEKPLARRVKDVDAMIKAATKAGKLFAIFQQSRFAPYFDKVQQVIDSGVYNVMGTQGGLHGTAADIKWRYYDPKQAPKHRATTHPIMNPDGSPAYCGEKLKMVEKCWTIPKSKSDLFATINGAFYKMLHTHMTAGGALEITPAQVRQQVAVIEACHRQNPQIWG